MSSQAGILEPCTPVGRHITFDLRYGAKAAEAIRKLAGSVPEASVLGLGEPAVRAIGKSVAGLRAFPGIAGSGVHTPSTQTAAWVFVREGSASDCYDTTRAIQAATAADFTIVDEVGTFVYRGGHDLSGYEDGTQNPEGNEAREVSIVAQGELAGSSFVAVQRWLHDIDRFQTMEALQRDHTIGRRIADNAEIPDAPVSAHVRRADQESFEPEAHVLRRSMPWSEGGKHGLYFVAFGASFDPFERILRRMVGCEDGVVDSLFAFTRPLTGGYYWCPPRRDGELDLSVIGL